VVPVIPMRKSRKLRVAVERCFNKLKNARRVASFSPQRYGGSRLRFL
ncbi:hypothetical protein DFP89_12063, partial [Paracoccus lutimaris]